jgi:hypothetical protein
VRRFLDGIPLVVGVPFAIRRSPYPYLAPDRLCLAESFEFGKSVSVAHTGVSGDRNPNPLRLTIRITLPPSLDHARAG